MGTRVSVGSDTGGSLDARVECFETVKIWSLNIDLFILFVEGRSTEACVGVRRTNLPTV